MKKGLLILLAMAVLLAGDGLPAGRQALAAGPYSPFLPFYWIKGTVTSKESGAPVANRTVAFYAGTFDPATAVLATTDAGGNYLINAFDLNYNFNVPVDFASSYLLKVPQESGAVNGTDETIALLAAQGYVTKNMVLTAGGGLTTGETTEEVVELSPLIKNIKFNNRVYSAGLVAKGHAFVVDRKPEISLRVEEQGNFGVDADSIVIVRDEGTTASHTYNAKSFAVFTPPVAQGTRVSAYSVIFTVPTGEEIPEKEHTFTFKAASQGLIGEVRSTAEVAAITVMGGPLRLIGIPLTYPSPYSISKDGTVTIQYELSSSANIEIYIIGVDGARVKHLVFSSGAEGGQAGINKVTWNGVADQGYKVGNAIYLGTIISRDEGRLLGKFKLTVVD